MAGVMDSVNQRTQLVGQNRLELLLFRLNGKQLYGINVFKVREVLQCPKLTLMPKSSPVVRGSPISVARPSRSWTCPWRQARSLWKPCKILS